MKKINIDYNENRYLNFVCFNSKGEIISHISCVSHTGNQSLLKYKLIEKSLKYLKKEIINNLS